jgi:hypothetical protein
MLLLECVTAYMAVQGLMDQPFPYKTAHALMMLKRELQPHVDFFSGEEMKLVERFAEKDTESNKIVWTGKGAFRFAEGKDPAEYARCRVELGSVHVDWCAERKMVQFHASITPAQLEALEKFIEFEEAAV